MFSFFGLYRAGILMCDHMNLKLVGGKEMEPCKRCHASVDQRQANVFLLARDLGVRR